LSTIDFAKILFRVSYNIYNHIILKSNMSENVNRVDHSGVKAMKFVHQLVYEMDRPPKVCIVSEAEGLLPAWVTYETKRLWKGNPTQTLLIKRRFSYV